MLISPSRRLPGKNVIIDLRGIFLMMNIKFFPIQGWAYVADQRMPDVLNVIHAAPGVPVFFERKKSEQQIDVAPDAVRAI